MSRPYTLLDVTMRVSVLSKCRIFRERVREEERLKRVLKLLPQDERDHGHPFSSGSYPTGSSGRSLTVRS